MTKSLNDIITEAQAEGADIATLVADLQALAAEPAAGAITPVSVAITLSDESVVTLPVPPAVAE